MLKRRLIETGQTYKRNKSWSVHWNPAGFSSTAQWNIRDHEYENLYIFSLKELRSIANAKDKADKMIEIASNLECFKDDLSDYLCIRLEPEPNQRADYKYISEFLTLEYME